MVINGTAPSKVLDRLRKQHSNIEVLQAPGNMHAETYLYLLNGGRANVWAIGVSHHREPCNIPGRPSRWRYFVAITNYRNIWWFDGFVR